MTDIIDDQATINIGTVGHVAHGKSTIVECISGRSTIRYKAEQERNITIKLGYANAKIYECNCERPNRYKTKNEFCLKCNTKPNLIRHVSFVDCPGHEILMTTMLTGAAIMDAALLLVAANEPCPQPQTVEHLFALEIMNQKNIVVLQNKIDLVNYEQGVEQYHKIQELLKMSSVDGPIVPVSGMRKVNIKAVLDFIVNHIPVPDRNKNKKPRMMIIRTFDVNKAGADATTLKGGVIGGSLLSGVLRVGDEIEIRPGYVTKKDDEFIVRPFITTVHSLFAELKSLKEAHPGGLIGVGTGIDPFFSKMDRLNGMIMGVRGDLPPIFKELTISYNLLRSLVKSEKDFEIYKEETILLNIGSLSTSSVVLDMKIEKECYIAKVVLDQLCCTNLNDIVAISKRLKGKWRLIGHGKILEGVEVEPIYEE